MSNKISNQERENVISSDDLLLISKSLNEYNSAWKSKAINFDDFAESMSREFRNRKFKDVLDTIQEIYNTYLNSGNLSINFDNKQKEIQLISEDGVFSKLDASELIFSGMIKDVKRIQKDGKPYIRFEIYINDGKEVREIDIPLGDFIDIYTAGNGLLCVDKEFSINEDIVATNEYVNETSTLLDNEIDLNYKELTSTISSVSSDLSTEISTNYAKKTELRTYTNGKGLDLNGNEFSVKDEVSAAAFSEATSWVNNQNYTTYENVKNNLSNDGYSMKVIFRDWEE